MVNRRVRSWMVSSPLARAQHGMSGTANTGRTSRCHLATNSRHAVCCSSLQRFPTLARLIVRTDLPVGRGGVSLSAERRLQAAGWELSIEQLPGVRWGGSHAIGESSCWRIQIDHGLLATRRRQVPGRHRQRIVVQSGLAKFHGRQMVSLVPKLWSFGRSRTAAAQGSFGSPCRTSHGSFGSYHTNRRVVS